MAKLNRAFGAAPDDDAAIRHHEAALSTEGDDPLQAYADYARTSNSTARRTRSPRLSCGKGAAALSGTTSATRTTRATCRCGSTTRTTSRTPTTSSSS